MPPAAASNRACGSLAHGSPTPFTAGIQLLPPGPVGPGGDDDPVQADQAEEVGRLKRNDLPAVAPGALMPFGDEAREAIERVQPDHVELPGGVSVTEVARPAAQEPVQLPHDLLDR